MALVFATSSRQDRLIFRMLRSLLYGIALVSLPAALRGDEPDSSWKRAQPGQTFSFPRDEFAHPDFQTEWWYYTGNLETADGQRRFGYQFTIFRRGLRPPNDREPVRSDWISNHLWFAHFAISDLTREKFHHTSRISRGAFGETPEDFPSREAEPLPGLRPLVWIRDWNVDHRGPIGHYRLTAQAPDFGLELELDTDLPPVFQGENGFSPKADDPNHASHYYSLTRLESKGVVRIGKENYDVTGLSWYDREWSTSLLAADQVGWDWFSLQFEDGSDLMLFQLRDSEGNPSFASGTLIQPDRSVLRLKPEQISLIPQRTWTPSGTKARYPIQWQASLPSLPETQLTIRAVMPDQRLHLPPLSYWEGAVTAFGFLSGRPASGRGYLEMTGYEGALPGLSSP